MHSLVKILVQMRIIHGIQSSCVMTQSASHVNTVNVDVKYWFCFNSAVVLCICMTAVVCMQENATLNATCLRIYLLVNSVTREKRELHKDINNLP